MGDGYGRVHGVDALVEPPVDGGAELSWFSGELWEFDAAGLPVLAEHGPGTAVRLLHEDGRVVALSMPAARACAATGTANGSAAWSAPTAGASPTLRRRRAPDQAGGRAYGVDDEGRVVSVTDADGVVEVANRYDEQGRVLAQLSAFGRETLLGYLPGAVTVTTDEQGGPDNVYLHDEHGARRCASTRWDSSPPSTTRRSRGTATTRSPRRRGSAGRR